MIVAEIPNSYIFSLSNGKFAIVEAPFGEFHNACFAVQNWIQDNELELVITESHPWKPTIEGYQLMQTNGEMEILLKILPSEA